MDILEFKAAYEWFLLRACFAALAALIATVVCFKIYEHIERLKAAAKRYGWPLVALFIAYSAWATYTAFPTQEEKQEYLRIQREHEALNNAWAQVFVPSQFPQNGLEYPTLSGGNNDKASNKASNPANEAEDYDAGVENDNLSNVRILSQEDFARGFVLTRIETNEVYDFTAPEGAIICEDWKAFGAAEDWIYLEGLGVSSQGLGDERLRVHSDGWVEVLSPTSTVFAAREYYPFKTTLGIVPEANWERIVFNAESQSRRETQSCFWNFSTPSNTLQFTWQNALYNRESDLPISFQVEFFENGDFTYRYDLSAIKAKVDSGNFPSNITIGTTSASLVSSPSYLVPSLSSLTFRRLDPDDSPGGDLDGDGLTVEDELFIHNTDPYLADTDFDGLCDYDEIVIHKSNPLDAYSVSNDYYDGFALQLQGEDPFSYPQGSTNTVLEHIFYSGTTNGVFSLPMSTDDTAVLKVNVSGIGSGRLIVGGKVVPLLPSSKGRSNSISPELSLAIPKNTKVPLVLCADETLALSLDSSDFAFGEMPPRGNDKNYGWIVFPRVKTTEACIHDFSTRKKSLTLPVEKMSEALTCTWHESADIKVENKPPRSTVITARFDARQVKTLEYTLSHPQYLFGVSTYRQQVRFCPIPPETENEEDVPPWYSGAGGGDLDNEDEIQADNCWCCHWGGCYGMCCGCEGDCSDGAGDGDIYESNFDEICPKHNSPYDECAYLHGIEYTNTVQNVQHLSGVLYLRDPPIYEPLALEVPAEHRNCCACPDHWTNYVAVAYKSPKLNITDAEGLPFVKTDTSCTVNVSGASPSAALGDAQFAFSRNGEICLNQSKTVFGIGIKSSDGRHKVLNSLNGNFGYPMTVATNFCDAAELRLVTDVKLPTGNIHLEFADVTGSFALWRYDSYFGEYRKLLDSETMPVKDVSLEHWREIYRRADVRDSSELPIYITSSASGTAKLIFRYWAVIDGKFVQDTAEQRISSVLPPLRVDLTRDGVIDDGDLAAWLNNQIFYYWINEDVIRGDRIGQINNSSLNSADLFVNGTFDLVNFFPVALDLSKFTDAWGNSVTYSLHPEWDNTNSFNFCFADVPWDQAGSIQTTDITILSGQTLSTAPLTNLPKSGYQLHYYDTLRKFSKNSGLLICEAKSRYAALRMEIKVGDTLLYSYSMPMTILPVKEMYSWYNFRNFSGEASGRETTILSHVEEYTKSLIFLHGANVSSAEAEVWGDILFKRLWISGSKARFYNLDWRSDIDSDANYHQNASNAFVVASQIVSTITNNILGEKVIMAHSLGNMVVSSMIHDYGLEVSKYLMCNSAVPAEAYDTSSSLRAPQLVHPDWEEYPTNSWTASWHTLFKYDTNDDRKHLGWPGRFANVIPYAVNFYSTGDEVLELAADNDIGIFTGITSSFAHHAWHKQELFKGRGIGVGAGVTDWSGWNIEENLFGVNKISIEESWRMTDADFKTNTVFYCYPTSMNSTNISLLVRGAHLAQGIPALTPAAGVTNLGGDLMDGRMVDMNDDSSSGVVRPNGWPSKSSYPYRWLHSDIKDVSYFFNFKFYEKLIEKGGLR